MLTLLPLILSVILTIAFILTTKRPKQPAHLKVKKGYSAKPIQNRNHKFLHCRIKLEEYVIPNANHGKEIEYPSWHRWN